MSDRGFARERSYLFLLLIPSLCFVNEAQAQEFDRINNRWKPNQYLHIEYGELQSGPIEPGWWSAQWIIELAADRASFICQAQSLNLFLPADINKWDLHMLHWTAWSRGIKSLYYCRSKSINRAAFAGQLEKEPSLHAEVDRVDYEECLACQ